MLNWQRCHLRSKPHRTKPAAGRAARCRFYRSPFEELEPRIAPSIANLALTSDPGVQQMPSIAVDPHNADHLVVAYMDRSLVATGYAGLGEAVSWDAGSTWQQTVLPLPAGFDQGAANPIVRFDDQGHVFVSFMAATFLGPQPPLTNPDFFNPATNSSDRAFGFQANNGIFLDRSDDGGLTWSQPVAVVSHRYDGEHPVYFEIIPDLAIDTFATLPDGTPNPRYGNMYAAWTRLYPAGQFPGQADATGGGDIMFAVSRDGGESWQPQLQPQPGTGLLVTVVQDSLNTGESAPPGVTPCDQAHIAIGPAGDIYVSQFGAGDFAVHYSSDGGRSFDTPDHSTGRRMAFGIGEATFINEAGLPTNHFRTHPLRAIVADPVRPGYVYATDAIYIPDGLGNLIDAADVFFARSTDYGVTWQHTFHIGALPASVLNDDNGGQSAIGQTPDQVISGQAMPRLAVDAQGNLSLIWYDTRRDPPNHLLDVFGTVSTDGGQTFSPNFRVTTQSFDADAGRFTDPTGRDDYYLGDFVGLAMANNTAYATWTDTRTGNQDVFFAHYPLNPAPTPPDDRFAPNQTAGTATDLGAVIQRTVPRLAVAAGADDWFRLETAATGTLNISATEMAPSRGLTLELRDASGATVLADGSDVLDPSGVILGQRISVPALANVTYLVHVMAGPDGGGAYSLDLQSLTGDLGTAAHAAVTGTFAPGDQAYYLVAAAASGSLDVRLTPAAGSQGVLSLELLDPIKRTVLATGQPDAGSAGAERAGLAVQGGRAVLIHLSGDNDARGAFSLDVTNLDQLTTPDNNVLFLPEGDGPSTVATGDLNGDGSPDLAIANGLSNTLSVFLNNGDGTLQAARQFALGAFRAPGTQGAAVHLPTFRRRVVLADLNRDGNLDAVVTNYDSGDVSVLLGRGDGTFEPQRRFNATASPFDVAVGDLNGDAVPDLVAVDANATGIITLAVLLGRGDGSFVPERTFTVATAGDLPFNTVRIADLNNDDKQDLVLSGSGEHKVTVFAGNGDGTFRAGADFPGSHQGAGLAVADLNADGNLDVVTTGVDPGLAYVLLGNGSGGLTNVVNVNTAEPGFPIGQTPVGLAVADWGSLAIRPDGSPALGPPDGHPDLIVADSGSVLALAPQGGPGLFVVPSVVDAQGNLAGLGTPLPLAPAEAPQDVAVADLNGDGVTDVVAVDRTGLIVVFGRQPAIPPNDTPQMARNLGAVVHVIEPTLTIVPGHLDAYFSLTAPPEAVSGAGDDVFDFSALFEHSAGPGLGMEVRDAAGQLLGSGARFQVVARQGEALTLHVFGVTAADGSRGAGAYTLDIDLLPQVVDVAAPALLPGEGRAPGGATASLVITLQGDRLDPAAAQDPANYGVTWLGPDGRPSTADDRTVAVNGAAAGGQSAVYDPSTNVAVGANDVLPTAVRQTVTLLFADPLPAGSYLVGLSPAIQAAPFNDTEAGLLADGGTLAGHPVVSVGQAQVAAGSRRSVADLVALPGALGDFGVWNSAGTPFLSQLHDDLGALLDGGLTALSNDPSIPPALNNQIVDRLGPALGAPAGRPTGVLVVWLDPVSAVLNDPQGKRAVYNLASGDFQNQIADAFVNVAGNIELVALPTRGGAFTLSVGDVPATARGGVVYLGIDQAPVVLNLTDALRAGTRTFSLDLATTPTPAADTTSDQQLSHALDAILRDGAGAPATRSDFAPPTALVGVATGLVLTGTPGGARPDPGGGFSGSNAPARLVLGMALRLLGDRLLADAGGAAARLQEVAAAGVAVLARVLGPVEGVLGPLRPSLADPGLAGVGRDLLDYLAAVARAVGAEVGARWGGQAGAAPPAAPGAAGAPLPAPTGVGGDMGCSDAARPAGRWGRGSPLTLAAALAIGLVASGYWHPGAAEPERGAPGRCRRRGPDGEEPCP